MAGRLYRDDPLSPQRRDEYERDLIAFCDRELDLLGDIRDKRVLYAGGKSPLWIEGLAERIGAEGSLTVLDLDAEGLDSAERFFSPEDLPLWPEYVTRDVFELPFGSGPFDVVYSSGLLHELDVRDREAGITEALDAMASVLRPGGTVSLSDFVSDVPSAQIEEEEIEAEVRHLSRGEELFGIGSYSRIGALIGESSAATEVRFHAPFGIRHLDSLFLSQPEPDGLDELRPDDAARLRRRWNDLGTRVEREGYTRPATVFAKILNV